MNEFISVDHHLIEQERCDYINEIAQKHSIPFKVAEEYIRLQESDPDNMFGDADNYLEEYKEMME